MEKRSGVSQSLETPRRNCSPSRRSGAEERRRSRSRDRSRSRPTGSQENYRVREVEACRGSHVRKSRSHSRQPAAQTRRRERSCSSFRDRETHRQSRSRSRRPAPRARRRKHSRSSISGGEEEDFSTNNYHVKRSRRSIFSSNDLVQLIKSIKDVLPSQQSNHNGMLQKAGLDHKNIIPQFNPSEKNQRIDVWIKKVNECAKVYCWDEKTVVHFAMQKLVGLAKTWYESLNSILFTWEEWQVKLLNAFPFEQNYGQMLEDMLKRRSRHNESIEIYYYEKLVLINQCELTGKRAVDCIIHGITDRTMRSSALALRCDEPDQILKFLLSSSRERIALSPSMIDRNLGTANAKQYTKPGLRINPNLHCYNCKEQGHPYSKCSKPLIKCNFCNRVGHKPESCKMKQDSGSTKGDSAKTMRISCSNLCNKFMKDITVNGISQKAFVDLGSEVTLIRQSTFNSLGIDHDHTPSIMRGFGNSLVQSVGSAKLTITIDGVTAYVSCRIVDDSLLEMSLLVGQSYSEQPHIVVYKDVNKLQFLHVGAELPDLIAEDKHVERVRIVAHCKIYGHACIRAATETVFTGTIVLDTKIIGKPNNQYVVCGGVYEVKNSSVFVVIVPCTIPINLHGDTIFSRAERVQIVYRVTEVAASLCSGSRDDISSVPLLDESQIRLGEAVTDSDRTKLIDLLQRYRECFAHDLAGLGCTSATEMKIELSSQRPIVYRPYRLSYHEREKVRTMIDDMLQAGIIRESVSNYASPIILVRKKEGGIRMCIDYRLLNSVTVKERYPMPVIEDEIARLSGQAWFVTLDLMSGYYQVPISEEYRHLTAFVTPDGQYEYNRMPFGLANAPAVFQRMMNNILGPARFDKATVYIDDLLVFGRDPIECMSRLEEVLILLQKANLKLNLSKCNFLQNTINYLGYEINSAGIRPGKSKILSVVEFPRPENVHSVRQFLGLVSYFRKFIQGFAQLAHPITKLLKKNVPWEWTKDQEESFVFLKAKLVDRPVLAIYDPNAETELHTDASRLGVGGILLQRPCDSTEPLHPVAYYSRQTSPEEKNFHSYELETLAVICALKKLRVYLLGKSFKIVTDCSALRSTFEKRDLIPRIARWWLAIQEFNCLVEYRAGKRMEHVDALSRNPVNDIDTQDPEQYPSVMVINNEDWLLTLQLGDPELRRIRDIIGSDLDTKGLEYIRNSYVLKNNKLFRRLEGDKECLKWVVPKGARWQLCKMNHDDIGHVGSEKTLERIQRNYWFAKMKRFVKKYVQACIDCAYAKRTRPQEGLLHPIEKIEKPFHTLHIDHLGPFVKSNRGNTYILSVVDSFTKFLFIKSVKNTNAQNAIRALEDIFDIFRTPDRVVSDRASCFTSHAFKRFCRDRGMKHVLNAVACPRANGQVERYNRTILDSLIAQNLRGDEKTWDSQLGRIQWGLNNTIQKTIGRSPAEVMFGLEMNSEHNPTLNETIVESDEVTPRPSIRREVKCRIDKVQDTQKRYYDKKRRPAHIYNKGDLVKITKVAFQNNGKSTKLMPVYEGPFKVAKVLGNDRYKVAPIKGFETMKNKRRTTVASDRMQPWIHVTSLEIGDDDNDVDLDTDGDII